MEDLIQLNNQLKKYGWGIAEGDLQDLITGKNVLLWIVIKRYSGRTDRIIILNKFKESLEDIVRKYNSFISNPHEGLNIRKHNFHIELNHITIKYYKSLINNNS